MSDELPPELALVWEDFFNQPQLSVADAADNLFEHPKLFPLQRKLEAHRMYQMANNPANALFIGADKCSDVWLGIHYWPSVKRICAIEIRGVPYAGVFRETFRGIDFLFLHASSYASETVEQVKHWLNGERFDFAFMDGDKSGYRKDYWSYLPLMAVGSRIAMHDVNPFLGEHTESPTIKAFKDVAGPGRGAMFIDTTELLNPPQNPYGEWLNYWGGASCGFGIIEVKA